LFCTAFIISSPAEVFLGKIRLLKPTLFMETLDATNAVHAHSMAKQPTYTPEEALSAATEYFDGDTLAAKFG